MNNNHTPNYNNTDNSPMHYALGPNSIFLLDGNKPIEISNDQINYKTILDAILQNDWVTVRENLDESTALINASHGAVSIVNNKILYHGNELHNNAAKKLTDLIAQGFTDVDRWLKFIDKLMANPSYNSREQAYNFIAHQGMPLTEDGNLIGYKGVRDDYKDKYSGQFDNSVGREHSMTRSHVDDNPNNGCSTGFHIGSHEYADSWASSDGRLMLVEYSPADIVSVPDEHLHGKLRVCRYKVIDECHTRRPVQDGAYGSHQEVDTQIFDFIEDKQDRYGQAWLESVQLEFPSATMEQIIDTIEEHNYHPDVSWDSNASDWQIRMN
tara:strand:- start:85 stop:1059 length:975 start_codon:yes stop_codon:yes gene_type:complete